MQKPGSSERDAATENPMRERILGAAFQAFMENGYAGTSTLEIATRAKVSKRDLYANFGSKQAILVACIAGRANRMRLPPNLPAPRSRAMLASALTKFGATVIRELSSPTVTGMFRLAIAEAERSPEVAQSLAISRSAIRTALAGFLALTQEKGILGDGDPRRMVEQFFALLLGDLAISLLLGIASPPNSAEVDGRARSATEMFLRIYRNATADSAY
jgi:AcrR family transcriptional regulator